MSCWKSLGLSATLVLGACVLPPAFNNYTRSFTISGGQTIEFTFAGGGIIPPENNDMKLTGAAVDGDAPLKTLRYTFGLRSKTGRAPSRVLVEDVSDAKPEILVEDDEPVLVNNLWHRTSGTKSLPDPRLDWLNEPDLSFRIFRLTVVTDDHRTFVMYYAQGYSPEGKAIMKKRLLGDPAPATP